jgi:hypothetical protein
MPCNVNAPQPSPTQKKTSLLARTLGVLALLLALAVPLILLTRDTDTIAYHLARLSASDSTARLPPEQFRDYFRLKTLSWYLSGCPPTHAQSQKEVQALIRLGYFERRDFPLQNRLLDAQFVEELHSICRSNLYLRTNYWQMGYNCPASIISVTIRKDCMPICESIITNLDRKVDN